MKKHATLLLTFLFALGKLTAQVYLPVPTTGYTLDAIAENTTSIANTGGAIDGSDYVMYSAAYGGIMSSPYGLPNSGLISSGTRTFQLQNYTMPNLMYITANLQDSLTIINPAAFTDLSLLGFATEGAGSMSVTVRFTDNSTQIFTGITVNDWFNTVPVPFYNGFDRCGRTSGAVANVGGAGNPRFFTHDMNLSCANQSKMVMRIIIKNTSGARLCIMALSAVKSPLNASASPPTLCNTGGTVTLTGTGVASYTWLPTGTFTGSSASTASVSPSVTTDYTVQGLAPSGCVLQSIVTVTVFAAPPTLTIASTANAGGICPNSTVMLTAGGATSYTWTGGAVSVTNGLAFSPATTATYVVTGANACGTSTAASSVSVHPFPTVNTAASSSSLCSGNTLTLTASGNATLYTWSGGPGPISNGGGFTPAIPATYTATGTSSLGCTASATIFVNVVQTPTIPPVASPSIVCIGSSSTLSAVAATNYTWTSSTQTVFTPTLAVTPSATGVTTYTVTKANSVCVDTKTISITTNSLPSVFALANPSKICALNPSTLSIAGAQSYTWTAPGPPTFTFTGSTPIVYPTGSSLYTVAASDGTCISIANVSVTVDPNPTVSISASSSSVCTGQSVTLTALGGNSYTWTTPSGTSSTSSIVVSPTAATAYTLTGDNSYSCTADASQIILVYQSPTVGITVSKALVCSGGPSTLTASGANSYTWDASAGNATTASVVVNPTATVSGPVVYSVTGINSLGCPDTKTAQVNVYVPSLSITGNTSTCAGGQVSLTASGTNASGFSWNTGSSSQAGSSLNTTVSAAAIFTVSASSSSQAISCPATQTVAISIYANPSVVAVAERTTICKNEQVDLQASGAVSYTWSNALNGATITVSPQNNITYTVTGKDANNCVNTGTVQVKVSACNGINEIKGAGELIQVYPNPNSGAFTIRAQSEIKLVLTNELGQPVRILNLSASEYQIPVTDLAEGIYFLSWQQENVQMNKKIVVTK